MHLRIKVIQFIFRYNPMRPIIILIALISIGCAGNSEKSSSEDPVYTAKYYYGLDSTNEFKFYKIYFLKSGKYQAIVGNLNKNTSVITITTQDCHNWVLDASGWTLIDGYPLYADMTKAAVDISRNIFDPVPYADGTRIVLMYETFKPTKDNSYASYIESLNLTGVSLCQ